MRWDEAGIKAGNKIKQGKGTRESTGEASTVFYQVLSVGVIFAQRPKGLRAEMSACLGKRRPSARGAFEQECAWLVRNPARRPAGLKQSEQGREKQEMRSER